MSKYTWPGAAWALTGAKINPTAKTIANQNVRIFHRHEKGLSQRASLKIADGVKSSRPPPFRRMSVFIAMRVA
ncbi:hypothetical protein AFIC_001047 [[Pseudomonas] carboxydohydrogena]|uniref:Uncharacterized protein n=1 Tax=Afipia carboxydohydrogena TaxID=290 RepID=A0ABY8BRD0_AFICR|nr:hypothetical protein [[Pseudomonas] carboxydohydrogena]WEF52555.1 hypothetical protein AFIC_001047 [[Pseudomonas] carboxydohydrogena]